ncbi:3-deoxy-D-manno-octulosonate 8-phosphate phosphatase [Sorangium cellulosum]|uniref:3-deoxy-D-manno-octulosonate 8-phosphate phosphatase n=1 Tax=Sorangium cellulosum TaxID=56 RepID=A0A2L0EWP0_SORCE|nr:3-deoxy-D-manno-octulosonate 8-phosphate phosphatase [Sorangium cellulosum]AUX43718.1 3-deoxy-D-manno-octulosonate 8-phosphate phosphatase [Sorangium cellulosum]
MIAISDAELSARARRIRLVLTDCDGVLTDTGVYYSERGEELKRFSLRDGMGVERLARAGVASAIVTGETSPSVRRRADKLGMRLFLGVRDKGAHLPSILRETGVSLPEVAYIGDDVNDLAIMLAVAEVGLTAAPADAVADVLCAAHRRCEARGGHGAFRDFADWILKLAS